MKKRIPKFKSLEEERKFWGAHSVTDFLDEYADSRLCGRKRIARHEVKMEYKEDHPLNEKKIIYSTSSA